MKVDREALRALLAERRGEPVDLLEELVTLLDACASYAKELEMSLPEFVEGCVEAYTDVHGLELRSFGFVEGRDPEREKAIMFDTTIRTGPKWGTN